MTDLAPRGTATTNYLSGLMLIDGSLVESSDGSWMESINPATEEVIGRIPNGTAADVDRAVASAETAQRAWADLSVPERAGYLNKLADAVEARATMPGLVTSCRVRPSPVPSIGFN
jgi:delta 1-pyrroline-5-carboxylate dehydrogenase